MKKATLTLALLIISNNTFANHKVPKSKIEYLKTYKTYAVATLETEGPNPDNCTATYKEYKAGRYVAIQFSDEGGKEMYSALLASYIANRHVSFGAGGCVEWGTNTIPNAYKIDVYRD